MNNRIKSIVVLASWLSLLVSGLCAQGTYPIDPGPVDITDREAVRQYFLTHFEPTPAVPVGYVGDPANGIAGDISSEYRRVVLNRVNAYRRMAGGVPIEIIDSSQNAAWQAGAMMCAANDNISHYPPSSWKYYTSDGATALAKSSLSLGRIDGLTAIRYFMLDIGPANGAAGHRMDILNHNWNTTKIGMAQLPSSSLWPGTYSCLFNATPEVRSNYGNPILGVIRAPTHIWPSPGYIPMPLIPGRWSVWIPPYDYESLVFKMDPKNAMIVVKRDGVQIPASIIFKSSDGLVFTLDGTSEGMSSFVDVPGKGLQFPTSQQDITFDIEIDNLRMSTTSSNDPNNRPFTLKYRVVAINPNVPRVERQPPAAFRPFVIESNWRSADSPNQLIYGWFDTITIYGGTRGATSYVWRRDGVVVPGATGDRLSLTITNQTAGDYSVTAIGPGGQTESFAAMVIKPLGSMPEAPVFVQHPESITITAGSTGTLRAKATGSYSPFYTWRKDGVTIPGFDTDLLDYYLINNAKFSDAGLYECVARNSMGTVVSQAALVTIVAPPPPTVLVHPVSKTALAGDLVSLTAVGSSPPNPTYQWRKDGTPIAGATGTALTWNKVALTNAGSYDCVISNAGGSVVTKAATVTVSDRTLPVITSQPSSAIAVLGGNVTFRVTATAAPNPTYQWKKNQVNITGATSNVLILSFVTAASQGTYECVVTNSVGWVTSAPATLTIGEPAAPAITAQPSNATGVLGQAVTFSVSASGTPSPTYQWFKDGVSIAGATGASHVIANAQASDAGSYTCVITNSVSSVTSTPAVLSFGPTAWLSNVSVRTALSSNQIMIVGFTVQGGSKDVLVRAIGPTLGVFGVPGTMVDPKADLYRGNTIVSSNDNWPASLASTFARLGAFALPESSKDAALVQLMDGGYTVQVSGALGGVVLVEGYDAGTGSSCRLINLSARNRSGLGGDVLIAGFNIAGSGTKTVLIRGIGPALAGFGVPGTLVDPKLEVFSSSGARIAENDNWDSVLATTFNSVGAFGFPPNSQDAALVLTLEAGRSYTVQVSGANSGTGEAMIEVYELP